MKTLHLTAAEQEVFDALPAALKEGWRVEAETLTYADSKQRQMIRLSLVRLHDPVLLRLRDRAQGTSTMEELIAVVQEQDLKDVNEDDLAELFFAMGPTILGALIGEQLKKALTDEDIEGVTALTVIRHALLTSFQPVSA